MRIALVARTIRRKGGTESYLFDLVGGFRQAGHQVDVFTMGDASDSPARAAGARVHHIPLGALPSAPRLWLFRAALNTSPGLGSRTSMPPRALAVPPYVPRSRASHTAAVWGCQKARALTSSTMRVAS